ncbi:lipocalin family protein [Ferruginibacter sp. SUN106]|uniref:lipocalin family protein n=1 Tax=Ferruginibacter sp. SUN106 TaxID=2978348 RepID=UPI003D360578
MNTVKMKWALTAIVCSTLFFSCKKDPVTPPVPDCSINMTNLSGAYKLTALQYKRDAAAPVVNYLDFMDACEKDDIVTLKSNGTYHYNDAGTVCTPNGSNDGTWSVNGNTINSDGTVNGTISSYDCKTLVYYAENVNLPGDKFTFTMVKQ